MDDLESLSRILKALSDPTRLRLLHLLSSLPESDLHEGCQEMPQGYHHQGQRYLCVNAMTKHLGVSQSAVSQHLRILKQAELVRGERRGSFVHYTLEQEGIDKYKTLLSEILGEQFINI
jgi:DNA-binding transcriptional ArsR family regulator